MDDAIFFGPFAGMMGALAIAYFIGYMIFGERPPRGTGKCRMCKQRTTLQTYLDEHDGFCGSCVEEPGWHKK